MGNLKDELNKIEVPSELRSRSRAGIEQAAREAKRKKQWLPTTLTAIVTAAMLMFIVSAIMNPTFIALITSGSASEGELLAGRSLHAAYIVAMAVTVLIILGVLIALRKFQLPKKWVLLGAAIILIWNWNIAKFKATELAEPFVSPIYVEALEGGDAYFYMNYAVNKEDEELYIERLMIDDVEIHLQQEEHGDTRLQERARIGRHISKQVQFHVTTETIAHVQGKNLDNSYVLFNDGSRIKLEVERFSFVEGLRGERLQSDDALSWVSGSVTNGFDGEAIYEIEPIIIEAIQFPYGEQEQLRYELKVGNTVIKRIGYTDEPDVDLLPYEVTEPSDMILDYELLVPPADMTMYSGVVIIYGANEFYIEHINNHLIIEKEHLQSILEGDG